MEFIVQTKTLMHRLTCCLLFLTLMNSGAYASVPASTEDQFATLANQYIISSDAVNFEYRSQSNQFGHLSRPWQTNSRNLFGSFSIHGDEFALNEVTERTSGNRTSKTFSTPDSFYRCDGDQRPINASVADRDEFLRLSCRYSPALLMEHALRSLAQPDGVKEESQRVTVVKTEEEIVARGSHGNEDYAIHFSVKTSKLKKIVWRLHHELWGDQSIVLEYSKEAKIGAQHYPQLINERTFETLTFQNRILSAKVAGDQPAIKIPEDYELGKNESKTKEIDVVPFSERITFLNLNHTDSRTTLVEYTDFLVVIAAPISSENGTMIIDKVKELKPDKPIRYFSFGHHHPHYVGGVRSFIAEGATILATEKQVPYLKQLAELSHTRQPDALQANPRKLKVKSFEGRTKISDGEYAIEIYDIGMKSRHTIDYLLFYFPKEKMLLQDDGVWLRQDRPVSGRTLAIHDAIVELELDVVDCIQSWPTQGFGVSTKIKFDELRKLVRGK